MSLGVGTYKVGGAGQCSSMRRRYPWQPREWPPPNRDLLGAWKRRGQQTGVKWNPRLQQPQAPSAAVASKNRHTYQMKAADSESNAKNCNVSPEQFGAKLERNVEARVLLEAGTRVPAPFYPEHSTRLRRNRSQVDKYEIKSQTNRNFFSPLSRLARGV